ncbi:hypothetical protein JCM19000A_30890 [Silvimonas sp. JCM 19000]
MGWVSTHRPKWHSKALWPSLGFEWWVETAAPSPTLRIAGNQPLFTTPLRIGWVSTHRPKWHSKALWPSLGFEWWV